MPSKSPLTLHCGQALTPSHKAMSKENKPLFQATLGDLKDLIEDMFASPTDYPRDNPPEVKRHLVYGLAGLAKLLGVCKATASKIKSSGILDSAISQHGKVIVTDADLALDLMRARRNASVVRNKTSIKDYGRRM